jgi:cell wall-associated NlpC family hydrolase
MRGFDADREWVTTPASRGSTWPRRASLVGALIALPLLLPALAAAAPSAGSNGASVASGDHGASTAATSRGAAVARFARRMVGVPYVTGGATPHGVDCSGLTMLAYREVGTELGHYTGDQWNSGPHRYKVSQLRPGDLVFFFSDHSHVGIYIGHGRLIHAPKPGDVVKVASMSNSWFAGNFSGSVRPRR